MLSPIRTFLFAAAIAAPPVCSAECLPYGQGELTGVLSFESATTDTGKTERTTFLNVPKPVCFAEGTNPKVREPAVSGIRKIQVLHPDWSAFEQARELDGKNADCQGTFFTKWTEHHLSPVVLRGTCVGAQEAAPAGAVSSLPSR